MNKIRMPIAALLFMAVLVSLSLAFGGSEGPRGAWEGPCGNPEVMRDLNLMPDQVTRIEELRVLFLNDVKPIRDKLFAKRGDLRLLWLEKNPNQAKIMETQREIRALRSQLQDKRSVYFWSIYNCLNSEQQAKFKAICQKAWFRAGFDRRRGFGGGMD